jgi:hypothetical protein
MSDRKEERFCSLGTTAAMVLKLDPAIYDTDTMALLGLTPTKGTATDTVPVTLRQASQSTGASLLKVTIQRGEGDLQEQRVVPLLCETSKVVTAKGDGDNGLKGKNLRIGGATTANWEIIKVV